ncbi:helix-turn-helix transcriptional regulator [Uliginosibacterium sp. H3]|uniref:Helix-turn-helix transcriptional regulator n=1 Tax=Uliginosibacterium silvisoli TaxID=3114758 RepID=A0ABU6K917_9RHOO|nr:helix-turn-helix transcriptional regulator [Uliginosibacterium sp. H3]
METPKIRPHTPDPDSLLKGFAAPYTLYDRTEMPVTALAADYLPDHETPRHDHPNIQLIHAVRGVMVVSTQIGQWIVPPSRGLWMPAGVEHSIRMVGKVEMRTAFIRPDAAPGLPTQCAVLGVSPLLRELLLAAVEVPLPYHADSRHGRLMRFLLDEVQQMPSLPLSLPRPEDPRLQRICETITQTPDDQSTAGEWAVRLKVDPKTIHRLFLRETGMTFGQWRQQARLLAALEHLAGGARVVDVALELGYNSPTAFATMFKRQFGVAPSSFFQ